VSSIAERLTYTAGDVYPLEANAGSSSVAIANAINDVLTYFGVTMVGGVASAGIATADENGPTGAKGLAADIAAQRRNERALLNVPGAIGHAVGAGNRVGPWKLVGRWEL
jgi:hypothetical protein